MLAYSEMLGLTAELTKLPAAGRRRKCLVLGLLQSEWSHSIKSAAAAHYIEMDKRYTPCDKGSPLWCPHQNMHR